MKKVVHIPFHHDVPNKKKFHGKSRKKNHSEVECREKEKFFFEGSQAKEVCELV